MRLLAYYNEHEPFAAQWLRNLIAGGVIAPGVVDERDIRDVRPRDLLPYTQVHLFAGIGVWSGAARLAGWEDDRPLWSCSCPCQPFSSGGKKLGFLDERHLWPAAYHLVAELQPPVLVGEQVASKDAGPWIDLVQADLEALDYAFGCVPFPSAGVGSPQIRDRCYWAADVGMGYPERQRLEEWGGAKRSSEREVRQAASRGAAGGLARSRSDLIRMGHTDGLDAGGNTGASVGEEDWLTVRSERNLFIPPSADAEWLADAAGGGRQMEVLDPGGGREEVGLRQADESRECGAPYGPHAVNGFWGAADWLFGRDAKWRPVEPGTFPLANGVANKMGLLRAYGNAVNLEAATAWLGSVKESLA